MTTQQIIDKFVTPDSPEHLRTNILMGIYLGMEYVDDDPDTPTGYFIDSGNGDDLMWIDNHYPEDWKFHESWDWLVPVVQKLQKDPVFINIEKVTGMFQALVNLDYEKMYKEASKSIEFILNKRDEPNL